MDTKTLHSAIRFLSQKTCHPEPVPLLDGVRDLLFASYSFRVTSLVPGGTLMAVANPLRGLWNISNRNGVSHNEARIHKL
jgi:hypothetical protein